MFKDPLTKAYLDDNFDVFKTLSEVQQDVLSRKLHRLSVSEYQTLTTEQLNYIVDVIRNCIIPDDIRTVIGNSVKICESLHPLIRMEHKEHFNAINDDDLELLKSKYIQALSVNQLATMTVVEAMINWKTLVVTLYDYDINKITIPMIQDRYEDNMGILITS